MPRNCGCQGQCSCLVRQGSGITVTGNGRPDTPYIISASSGGGGGGGAGFETGDLKWTALPAAPTGWLVCDGAAVSRTEYDDLFTAIGTTYGAGDGATTFNLPDYTGRFVLGADSSHEQGTSGGSEERTLQVSQMPGHDHSMSHDHPDHNISMRHLDNTSQTGGAERVSDIQGLTGENGKLESIVVNTPPFSGRTGDTGGGQPFSIMPPYGTALPLIKT